MQNLIETILKKRDAQGNWQISRDEILDLLGLSILDVYKLIVTSSDPMVDIKYSSFSQNDTGALISLLECLGCDSAAQIFWYSGLWIPYGIQVELQETLIDVIAAERYEHKVDYDTFLSMFDHVSSFHQSLDLYLEGFFSQDEIIQRAIERIIKRHSLIAEDLTMQLLKKFSFELFRRDILPYRNLFSDIFVKLKDFLIEKGRMKRPTKSEPAMNNVQKKARQLLGFSENQPITLKELKKRYKNLMKKYHPDVNPNGLELAKDINHAYSVLLP